MECKTALTTTKKSLPDLLVTWKTNGGLNCHHSKTERCIVRMLNVNKGGLPHSAGLSNAIAKKVLQVCVESGVFSMLDQHMLIQLQWTTTFLL